MQKIASLLLACCSVSVYAQDFKVAVAANFRDCFQEIESAFSAQYPQYSMQLSVAASGILYAQILAGAPFDVFLSADNALTAKLTEQKLGFREYTYARGKLALWAPDSDRVDADFLSGYDGQLAIANPVTAPYGRATMTILSEVDTHPAMQIVRGNNAGQAYQFVVSGNARAGIIAYSFVFDQCEVDINCWIIPQSLYPPIYQNAVLLSDKPAAIDFYDFLQSSKAREIIRANGYDTNTSISTNLDTIKGKND